MVLLAVVLDVGVLFVFKYLNFTVDNLNRLLKTSISIPNIALPIGISFLPFKY